MNGFESDQDEWDILNDQTLMKTISHDRQIKLDIGDKVKLAQGQYRGLTGTITQILKNGQIQIRTEDKFPVEIKVLAEDAVKQFERGESVRVISGAHSGEVGLITDIINDKHAVITLETSNSELKILLSNIRSKNCEQEHIKQSEFVKKSSILIRYQAGDIILYDNYQKTAIVLQVYADSLKVLDEQNKPVIVKFTQISKKVMQK